MNGFIPEDPPSQSLDTADATGARLLQTVPIPPRFDWRDEGKVSAVKNQGSCSVCWAFAATAFLESLAIIRGQFRNNIQLAE
jgi:C1A family cysteine protease